MRWAEREKKSKHLPDEDAIDVATAFTNTEVTDATKFVPNTVMAVAESRLHKKTSM
jgi:hypothetical protein